MKTWNDYKEHVRTVDPEIGKDIDEVENISSIVSAMVEQRTSLGLSQKRACCYVWYSTIIRSTDRILQNNPESRNTA